MKLLKKAQLELVDKKNRQPKTKAKPVKVTDSVLQEAPSVIVDEAPEQKEPDTSEDIVAEDENQPSAVHEATFEPASADERSPDASSTSLNTLQDSSIQALETNFTDFETRTATDIQPIQESESQQSDSPDRSLPEISVSALDRSVAVVTASSQMDNISSETNDASSEIITIASPEIKPPNVENPDPLENNLSPTKPITDELSQADRTIVDSINDDFDANTDDQSFDHIKLEPVSMTETEIEIATDQLIVSTEFSIEVLGEIERVKKNDQKISEILDNEPARIAKASVDSSNHWSTDSDSPNGDNTDSTSSTWLDNVLTPEASPVALDEIIRPAKRFYPEMRLLGIIKSLISSAENCHLKHQHYPPLTIYPQTNTYSFAASLENAHDIFQIPAKEFAIDPFNWHEKMHSSSNEVTQPLWVLIYAATLYGSEGRLLQNTDAHVTIRLRETPDFSKIPHTDEHLRIATYLRDYAANLSQIATVTQTSIRTVIDFTNACREINLVEETGTSDSTSSQPKAPSQPQRHGLLTRIRESLLGRSAVKADDER